MFAGKNAYWYAAGSLSEPIFDAGRIRSNYHLSQAQEQEMLLDYQKTILNALKDVSDSLVGYKETRERREQQAALTLSAVALLAVWLPATGAERSSLMGRIRGAPDTPSPQRSRKCNTTSQLAFERKLESGY